VSELRDRAWRSGAGRYSGAVGETDSPLGGYFLFCSPAPSIMLRPRRAHANPSREIAGQTRQTRQTRQCPGLSGGRVRPDKSDRQDRLLKRSRPCPMACHVELTGHA
jgi:hypothetical protein